MNPIVLITPKPSAVVCGHRHYRLGVIAQARATFAHQACFFARLVQLVAWVVVKQFSAGAGTVLGRRHDGRAD
jgi:hypothetical protein